MGNTIEALKAEMLLITERLNSEVRALEAKYYVSTSLQENYIDMSTHGKAYVAKSYTMLAEVRSK